jgi:hypothetical protein
MESAPDLTEIRAQRDSALLEKWGKGTRLSRSELDEIAPLIAEAGGTSQLEPEVEPGSTLPSTDLLGDPIGDETGTKSKKGETVEAFARTLAEYAEIYDRSTRVIKRWIATGRKNPTGVDLPPLDDPRNFPGWWRRNQRQRVPLDLMDLAQKSPKKKEGEGGRAAPENNGDGDGPGNFVHQVVPDVEGSGFAAELERIKERTRIAASKLAQAEANRDELAIEVANKRYSEALKLLREFERDAQAILEKQGELIPRQALEMVVREAHTAIRDRMRSGIETVRAQLKSAKSPEAEREVWDVWLDSVFRLLAETEFVPDPQDDPTE